MIHESWRRTVLSLGALVGTVAVGGTLAFGAIPLVWTVFKPGDPIRAAELNANFEILAKPVVVAARPSDYTDVPEYPGKAIVWDVEDIDSHGALDGATFKAPLAGAYLTCATVGFLQHETWPAGAGPAVDVYVNASTKETCRLATMRVQTNFVGGLGTLGGCTILPLQAGNEVQVKVSSSVISSAGGDKTVAAGDGPSHLSITRL